MLNNIFLTYLVTNASIFYSANEVFRNKVYEIGTNSVSNMNDTVIIDYDNIRQLAIMCYDAYLAQNATTWVDTKLNVTVDLSLSPDSVHAYLFSNVDKTVNVVAFKGTSIYWQSTHTSSSVYNDRFNDNLYFSCCFYKQSNLFEKDMCVCTMPEYPSDACPNLSDELNPLLFGRDYRNCYKTCYQNSTKYENNYLNVGKKIISNVQKLVDFQTSQVVFTGHSLGGMIATLMGLEYEKQVITFEAPGTQHYIQKTGLIDPFKMKRHLVYNFGHTADIIFKGKCNGAMSWCYLGGYVMETKCHIGYVCEYDTVGELGMKESIFAHPIKFVIDSVIDRWNKSLPRCTKMECHDCTQWVYT